MSGLARSRVVAAVVGAVALLVAGASAPAHGQQYFGRNKVNYETFDFRTLATPKFDLLHYPVEAVAAQDAARMAERWYARLSPFWRHEFGRKQLIFFADQPDFQQNNVTDIESEGTGGVTEGFRQRVIMPFTGVYAETDHVLGHELVHVFQYDYAEKNGGIQRLSALPLWLVEGMAEYLSLGRSDVLTATWLRDAARRNDVPSIRQLTTDPRYFPYRYGQALWAYVGGRFGDQAVIDVFKNSIRFGFEQGIRRTLDITTDQLSRDWAASIRSTYLPQLAGRTPPDSTGRLLVAQRERRGGEFNTSPVLSPDGRTIAFFSSRDLFGIDVFIADAQTGRVIRQLGSVNTPRHFDALSFINSAGSWSPDGRQFAYVVYREGNQELAIYDLARRRAVRTLRTPNIGAAVDPAWSPDGKSIAFVGQVGGITNLYRYDLDTDALEQLTEGKYSVLQPAWSPDGRSIAFATDRGPGTDLENTLTYSQHRLAIMDVATRGVRLLQPFVGARHINPAYAPDGRSLYFVADPDGFSDLYRVDLQTGRRFRVTRTATGISGIGRLSPALTVARESGRVAFSVFDRGGFNIASVEGAAAAGTPLDSTADGRVIASAGGTTTSGELPPLVPASQSTIERYLDDATTGLPAANVEFADRPLRSRIGLNYVAPPQVGVGYSGAFGAQLAGGVAALFGDQLNNQQILAVVQAQGQLQDIGGQVFYQNSRRRWNWGLGAGRIPFVTGFSQGFQDPQTGATQIDQVIQRIFIDQASAIVQYPLSPIRRFEFSASGTRQSYSQEVFSIVTDRFGNPIDERRTRGGTGLPAPLAFAQASAAFVGDYSFLGFTSPIAGGRYRFEVSPAFGDLTFTSVTADYRRYFLVRPVTFAFRGLHVGRYGERAANQFLNPLYLGFGTLVRGYDVGNNLAPAECASAAQSGSCPVFDRLIGSRIGVASAELRIPLLGPRGLGLLTTNLLPLEIAPFVDAGVAWSGGQRPDFRFARGDAARAALTQIPVMSTGLTARANVLGFAVVEAFYAFPFQRPDKGAHFGFQIVPGW